MTQHLLSMSILREESYNLSGQVSFSQNFIFFVTNKVECLILGKHFQQNVMLQFSLLGPFIR